MINGFGFEHLTLRPRKNRLRRGKADTECGQSLSFHWVLSSKIEFFLIILCIACSRLKSETNKGKRFETFPQALAVCTWFSPSIKGLYARMRRPSRVLISEESVNLRSTASLSRSKLFLVTQAFTPPKNSCTDPYQTRYNNSHVRHGL